MKISLYLNGRTTERSIAAAIDEYSARIGKYNPFEVVVLPDLKNTRNMPAEEQKAREGIKIIQSLRNDDFVVLLDEKGKEFTTLEFAGWLEKLLMSSHRRIVFITGGPWGFSSEVYDRAHMKLSLSKMTFTHQMVRLLFLEQLYRIFTVIKGDPYHHQ
ncbi:MAG: 23S rRNA (pseudouridine(1915)-N(3))-methyltransferase RlmH [Bacteroidales bacterium]|jgi:23S rRNA (pseudouridine1915-N3)-methyltransferase|nr:23S rRNA (pseudouridine(1915)-N(3))-methyltransferase RlmH [Bacteroidales bacterium]